MLCWITILGGVLIMITTTIQPKVLTASAQLKSRPRRGGLYSHCAMHSSVPVKALGSAPCKSCDCGLLSLPS